MIIYNLFHSNLFLKLFKKKNFGYKKIELNMPRPFIRLGIYQTMSSII